MPIDTEIHFSINCKTRKFLISLGEISITKEGKN